ncbi:MAG: 13E12 repeat family protein [Candidatus Dormibacteraeota bacterium]|nr:13E12 repeat family protein [Candidatus Dormibacteraeota bacterium]
MGSLPESADRAPLVDRLHGVISDLAQQNVTAYPCSVQTDELNQLNRAINRLQAEFTRRTRILDQNQGWVATGALSTQAWLRRKCHLSAAAAADRVRLGSRLEDLPQTTTAFGEGAISLQHASLLCRTCEQVGVDPTREAEPILVQAARELDPRQLRVVTERFRYCTDPDGVAREVDATFERRYFDLSQTWDGIYFLNGMLGGSLQALPP